MLENGLLICINRSRADPFITMYVNYAKYEHTVGRRLLCIHWTVLTRWSSIEFN